MGAREIAFDEALGQARLKHATFYNRLREFRCHYKKVYLFIVADLHKDNTETSRMQYIFWRFLRYFALNSIENSIGNDLYKKVNLFTEAL